MFTPTDSEDTLRQYVSQCIEALETGRFLYFAHPDVINFTGNEDFYRSEMRRLCVRVKQKSTMARSTPRLAAVVAMRCSTQ